MSSNIKTKVSDNSVTDFINSVDNDARRSDSLELLQIFTAVTGEQAKLWGTSIVGFGQYHCISDRSKQEGDWPLTGFSPRKQNLTLYIMNGFDDYTDLLSNLGKYKTSKSCLYLNKLSDVDNKVLEKIIGRSYDAMQQANNA